jgi:SNF2 family DNA or RNA helicase
MGKKTLYLHQLKALEQTEGLNKVAYYMDMGLGKTITGIEKMKSLHNKTNLIICQKSMIGMWTDEVLQQWDNVTVYNLSKKREYELYFNDTDNIKVGVINYDLVHRRKELNTLDQFTLLLDESSMIQNDNTKRTRAIMKLKYENLILLSGTPVNGAYEKLYSQIRMLGWNITKTKYWEDFIDYVMLPVGLFSIKKVRGYHNIGKLKRKLRELGCVFMKSEDVYLLPEQIETNVKIPNISHYKTMLKDDYVKIKGTELIGSTSVTKLLRLRQLCGIYNDHKTTALLDILEGTEDRVIVFYNFTSELEVLLEVVKKLERPICVFNGDNKDLKPFYTNDRCILFAQYQAGARGLNLQDANKIIYYTLPLSSELYEQSKKRTHRLGQKRRCFYYNLLVENSIENEIFKSLQEKKDYTDELFRQHYYKE